MTEANEQTVEDGGRTLASGSGGGHRFKAIRASIGEGEAHAQVIRVSLAEDLTLRDLDALLDRLPEGGRRRRDCACLPTRDRRFSGRSPT